MAWVGKRGKYWSVRYRVANEQGIETQKRKSGFVTKEDAWAAAKELEQKSNAGIDIHGDQETCGYVMERWFTEHCSSLAATTKSKYSDGIDRLRRTFIYDMPIKRVNGTTLSNLIEGLKNGEGGKVKLSLRTAIGLTESLRLSLGWATRHGIIPRNPLTDARLPKVPKRKQKILNEHDIEDILQASEDRAFYTPLLLAIYGGLRREEAAALQWDNVDFKRRTITLIEARTRTTQGQEVTKDTKSSNSMRTITMPKFAMDILKHKRKSSEYVCVTDKGTPYQLDSFPQATRRLIQSINRKREGTKVAPMPQASYHDLRHTHAAMLIRIGVQPKVIQERLGHSSIKITMDTYGYLMSGLQEGVADSLDAEFQSRKSGRKSGRVQSDAHGNTRACRLVSARPASPEKPIKPNKKAI